MNVSDGLPFSSSILPSAEPLVRRTVSFHGELVSYNQYVTLCRDSRFLAPCCAAKHASSQAKAVVKRSSLNDAYSESQPRVRHEV